MSTDPKRANNQAIPSNRPQAGWVDDSRIRNRDRDRTFTTDESEIPFGCALSAVRWAPDPSRPTEWVVRETGDGLAKGDPSPARWLPQGWTMHYFPIGLRRGDLASWFDFAERIVNFYDSHVENGRPWPADGGAYIPSAVQIADHAFLLLVHLKKQKMLRSGPVNRPRRPLPPLLAVRAIRNYVDRHLDPVTESDGPAPPPNPLVGLLALRSEVSKQQGEFIELFCSKDGRVDLLELAVRFGWPNPKDNWNSLRKRLNDALKNWGWRFFTKNGCAVVQAVPVIGRK
jgi:hypothetical protein